MSFEFIPKKPRKLDEIKNIITNYEELSTFRTNTKFNDPFEKKRGKPLTDCLLKSRFIDEQFILTLNSIDIIDLLLMRFESLHEFLDIKTKPSISLLTKRFEDSLIIFREDELYQEHIEHIKTARKYKEKWKKYINAKK